MTQEEKQQLLAGMFQGADLRGAQVIAVNEGNVYYQPVCHSNGEDDGIVSRTDEQIARALVAVTGKDKVLNNQQLWLGACCLLMGKYGFPKNLSLCCEKILGLPYGDEKPELECKYDNIRKFAYMRFVREDVDTWDSYQPKDDEKRLFYGCQAVASELRKTLKGLPEEE